MFLGNYYNKYVCAALHYYKLIVGIYIIIRYLALKDVSVMSVPYDPFIFHKFGADMDFDNFEPKMES